MSRGSGYHSSSFPFVKLKLVSHPFGELWMQNYSADIVDLTVSNLCGGGGVKLGKKGTNIDGTLDDSEGDIYDNSMVIAGFWLVVLVKSVYILVLSSDDDFVKWIVAVSG